MITVPDRRASQADIWAYGRQVIGDKLNAYCAKYGEPTPPPAIAIRDLIQDFFHATLRFDALSLDVFGKSQYTEDGPIVTVNAQIGCMPGVKDVVGVENVCLCHEAIHLVRDKDFLLGSSSQSLLPGLGKPVAITCYRGQQEARSPSLSSREYWAEEAGRAAAVSLRHLLQSQHFLDLIELSRGTRGVGAKGWQLVYDAAAEIGVNRTAVVKQLQLEGWIAVERVNGSNVLYVQPALIRLAESREDD